MSLEACRVIATILDLITENTRAMWAEVDF